MNVNLFTVSKNYATGSSDNLFRCSAFT